MEYLDYASCKNEVNPMVWSCQFWYKVKTELLAPLEMLFIGSFVIPESYDLSYRKGIYIPPFNQSESDGAIVTTASAFIATALAAFPLLAF